MFNFNKVNRDVNAAFKDMKRAGQDVYNTGRNMGEDIYQTSKDIYGMGNEVMRNNFANGGMIEMAESVYNRNKPMIGKIMNTGRDLYKKHPNEFNAAIRTGRDVYNTGRDLFNKAAEFGRANFESGGEVKEYEEDISMNPGMEENEIKDEYVMKEDDGSNEFEAVHMAPNEIENLIEIQGSPEMTDEGFIILKKLGKLLAHPEIKNYLENFELEDEDRIELASGGLAGKGIMGDTEIVYLPKNAVKAFDKIIGGASINPNTGRRQYYLGNLLGKIGKGFTNAFTGTGNYLRNMVKPIGQGLESFGRGAVDTLGQGMQSMGTALGGNFDSGQIPQSVQNVGMAGADYVRGELGRPDFEYSRPNFERIGRGALNRMGEAGLNQIGDYTRSLPGASGEIARGAYSGFRGGLEGYQGSNPMDIARAAGEGALRGGVSSAINYGKSQIPRIGSYLERQAMERGLPMVSQAARNAGVPGGMVDSFSEMAGIYAPQLMRTAGNYGSERLSNYLDQIDSRFGRR